MMTKEERNLLFKDLSARLPYSPCIDWGDGSISMLGPISYEMLAKAYFQTEGPLFKLYLRPMSEIANLISAKEYSKLGGIDLIDWYNANHIDYRGLIEKGLAIKVTEENNPYKE